MLRKYKSLFPKNTQFFPQSVNTLNFTYSDIDLQGHFHSKNLCDSLWEKGALHAKIEIEI